MSNFSFPPPPPPPPRAAPDYSYINDAPQRGRGGFNSRGRGGSNSRGRGNSTSGRGSYTNYNNSAPHGQGLQRGNANFTQPNQQPNLNYNASPPSYGQPSQLQPQHGIKRKRGDFHDSRGRGTSNRPDSRPKVAVAPAVPAFGGSLTLPFPSPAPVAQACPPAQQPPKKRKTNFLGLTPAGADVQSSSEDDNDEEASLAASKSPMLVEYRGQTMSLGSIADIKAWIAERKKRWPTKERVEARETEEKKRRDEQAEARRKVIESRNEEQMRRREAAEAERRGREEAESARREAERAAEKLEHHEKKESKEEKQKKKLEKILAKAEKLKKSLEKGRKKVKATEVADGSSGVEQTPKSISAARNTAAEISEEADSQEALPQRPDQEYPKSLQKSTEEASLREPVLQVSVKDESTTATPQETSSVNLPPSAASEDISNADENSDSEDSSDSASDSDSDDDTSSTTSSSPEETSAKHPVPGLPPTPIPPTKSARPCRDFVSNGYCKAGEHCRFRHELPERGSRGKEQAKEKKERAPKVKDGDHKKERKTLWQRLVEQEQEQENRAAVVAVRFMGDNGMLGTFEVEGKKGEVLHGAGSE